MHHTLHPSLTQYPMEDCCRRGPMPTCGFLSLIPALLPVGDEFWINCEGLGVVYSTFLLFPSTCFRVGSELRREEQPRQWEPKEPHRAALYAWSTGELLYVQRVISAF